MNHTQLPSSSETPLPSVQPSIGEIGSSDIVVLDSAPVSDYFRIIAKYRRLVLAMFIMFVGGAMALCFTMPSQYVGTSLVAIEPYLTPLPDTGQQAMLFQYSNTEFYAKNRMNVLASHELADRVLSLPGVGERIKRALGGRFSQQDYEEAKALGYKNPVPLLERYLKRVDNLRLPTTTTTRVWGTMPDAQLAADATNAHVQEFIKLVREDERKRAEERVVYLERRSTEIAARMLEAQEEVKKFLNANPLSMGIFSEFSDFARLSPFDPELKRLGDAYAEAIDKKSSSQSTGESLKLADIEKLVDEDSSLTAVRARAADLQAEYARLREQYQANHPKVRASEAAIAAVNRNIQDLRTNLLEKLVEQRNYALRADEEHVTKLGAAIGKTQEEAASFVVQKFSLQAKEREFLRIHELFDLVTKNLEEARMTAAVTLTNINVLSAAVPPAEPTSPNRPVILIIACFLGPLFGCVLAFLLNMLDSSIYTVEDMVAAMGVPSLGMIPSLGVLEGDAGPQAVAEILPAPAVTTADEEPPSPRDRSATPVTRSGTSPSQNLDAVREPSVSSGRAVTARQRQVTAGRMAGGETMFHGQATQRFTNLFRPLRNTTHHHRSPTELLTLVEPFSEFTEAFRNIRTSVVLQASGREAKTILVTSSLKGEGKSTVAANLAVSLAQYGNRVLLVDGDLRRATLHLYFGMDRDSLGLTNYLRGEKGSHEIVFRTSVQGLDFVAAGTAVPNPSELLGTKLTKQFFELMVESYDYIIVDAPPVLPVADARVLALVVDSVLYVVRSGITERQVARNGVLRLRQLGIGVAGGILNDVDVSDAMIYHEVGGDAYDADEQIPWFAQIRSQVSSDASQG